VLLHAGNIFGRQLTYPLLTVCTVNFYRATPCYIAVYAVILCLSVTSRCFIESLKRLNVVTQTTPHDSPAGTLVFGCRRSRQNSNGVTPTNILRSLFVARTPPVEARSPGHRSNVENAPVDRQSTASQLRPLPIYGAQF